MAIVDSVDGADFFIRLDQDQKVLPEMMGSLVHVRCKPAGFILALEETLPLESVKRKRLDTFKRMQQEEEAAEATAEAADSDFDDEAERATRGKRKKRA